MVGVATATAGFSSAAGALKPVLRRGGRNLATSVAADIKAARGAAGTRNLVTSAAGAPKGAIQIGAATTGIFVKAGDGSRSLRAAHPAYGFSE